MPRKNRNPTWNLPLKKARARSKRVTPLPDDFSPLGKLRRKLRKEQRRKARRSLKHSLKVLAKGEHSPQSKRLLRAMSLLRRSMKRG